MMQRKWQVFFKHLKEKVQKAARGITGVLINASESRGPICNGWKTCHRMETKIKSYQCTGKS